MAASRQLLQHDWEASMDEEFDGALKEALDALAAEGHAAALPASPSAWPGFATRRARLYKAAARLRALLGQVGGDAEFVCEHPMSALDGRLRGRPDLVVRDKSHHWVVDYKTGSILEHDNSPKSGYVRQLLLYSVMERAESGSLPDHAWLVPLKGAPLDVPVAEQDCDAVSEELLQALEGYNERAPGPQPASPSADSCGWCPYAGVCPGFWAACGEDWAHRLLALRGVVTHAQRAVIGGVTVSVEVKGGSVAHGRVSIRGISLVDQPEAALLEPGARVAVRGLRQLDEGGIVFAMREGASLWVFP
jgi:RecB family exonuclease